MSVRRCLLALAVLAATAVPSFAQADSLHARAEDYFARLYKRFEKTVDSKYAKGTNRRSLDQHFVWVMRRFPTMHAFVKTNSKGKLINKVMFGRVPKSVVEDIPDDTWYSHLKTNQKERKKIWFDRESGRYYLVWSKPVEKGPNNAFVGVVAVKIDLWDTFHRFAKSTHLPFLAFVNGTALYAHDWERSQEYTAAAFDIPGARKASLRWVGTEAAVASAEDIIPEDEDELAEDAEIDTAEAAVAATGKKPTGTPWLAIIVSLVVGFAGGGVSGYLFHKKKQQDAEAMDWTPRSATPEPRPLDELIDTMPDQGPGNLPDEDSHVSRDDDSDDFPDDESGVKGDSRVV